MEVMRFGKQKRLAHKYATWMYHLLAEGRFYDLPQAKEIHDLPKEFHYSDIEARDVRYFEKIYHCADVMNGFYNKETGKTVVTDGFFCGTRFCPICAIKKSLREYSKLTYQMEQFQDKYDYFMFTLTLPNNPDGFRDEIKLLSSCLRDLLGYFGFRTDDHKHRILCHGAYGSYEITKSDAGWHPHLHLILAFPKEFIVDFKQVSRYYGSRKRNFINKLVISDGVVSRSFDHTSVMNKFIELVKKRNDKYNDRLEDLNFLNIGFEKCYDIEKGRNELSKYLIDFEALEDYNDLYVFMRDAYRIKQRVRRGIFIWTDEWQEKWRSNFEESQSFVQSEEDVKVVIVYESCSYYVKYYDTYLEQVPYTNTYKEKSKLVVVKLE